MRKLWKTFKNIHLGKYFSKWIFLCGCPALNRLLYVYFLFILRILSIFISGLLFLGMYTLLHFHILWLCF